MCFFLTVVSSIFKHFPLQKNNSNTPNKNWFCWFFKVQEQRETFFQCVFFLVKPALQKQWTKIDKILYNLYLSDLFVKLAVTKWIFMHVRSDDGLFATLLHITSRISCLLHHTIGRSLMRRALRLRVPTLPSPPSLFYVSLGAALFSPRSAATPCQFFPIHQRAHSPTITATPDESRGPSVGCACFVLKGTLSFGREAVDGHHSGVCSDIAVARKHSQLRGFHQSLDDFACLPEEAAEDWKEGWLSCYYCCMSAGIKGPCLETSDALRCLSPYWVKHFAHHL